MKKLRWLILFGFFVLGSIFYLAPSLLYNDPLMADISLKPNEQDLLDLGKLIYKKQLCFMPWRKFGGPGAMETTGRQRAYAGTST